MPDAVLGARAIEASSLVMTGGHMGIPLLVDRYWQKRLYSFAEAGGRRCTEPPREAFIAVTLQRWEENEVQESIRRAHGAGTRTQVPIPGLEFVLPELHEAGSRYQGSYRYLEAWP